MDIAEWIGAAIMVIIGAYILFVVVQSLSETTPGFGQYGWYLFAAFIAGAAIFLRYGLRQRK